MCLEADPDFNKRQWTYRFRHGRVFYNEPPTSYDFGVGTWGVTTTFVVGPDYYRTARQDGLNWLHNDYQDIIETNEETYWPSSRTSYGVPDVPDDNL